MGLCRLTHSVRGIDATCAISQVRLARSVYLMHIQQPHLCSSHRQNLSRLRPVTCSAAVALYGHRPMPTVSPSSENPNHTVVCRALSSLVPVGSLAVSPMAPLPAQLQSHRPPCCPETCQGCSRLAAFMLHPLPEKLFLIHFCAKGALSRGLSCSSPAHSVTRPCPTSSEHLSHLTVCI